MQVDWVTKLNLDLYPIELPEHNRRDIRILERLDYQPSVEKLRHTLTIDSSTETVSVANLNRELTSIIHDLSLHSEVIIAGHALHADERLLKSAGVTAFNGLWDHGLDTQLMGLAASKKYELLSLGNLAASLGLQPKNLHNASSDAVATLHALLRLSRM